MIIIGAKGHAKEVLDILIRTNYRKTVYFYDDINLHPKEKLFDNYSLLKTEREVIEIFNTGDNSFALGLGNPKKRFDLFNKFESLSGCLKSIISSHAYISAVQVTISSGVTIMPGAVIMSGVKINKGVLLNPNCTISHDSTLNNFVECAPGVNIAGNVFIDSFTQLGTGASIKPNVKIGKNCIIGAGAVVISDIPDSSVVVGVPGKVIKKIDSYL
jgi:sugar O-acyltransferase (sialic acid O-acetyltransferase NeuD family)